MHRFSSERSTESAGVRRWLSTANRAAHFWTGANGVTRFSIVYQGVERAGLQCE